MSRFKTVAAIAFFSSERSEEKGIQVEMGLDLQWAERPIEETGLVEVQFRVMDMDFYHRETADRCPKILSSGRLRLTKAHAEVLKGALQNFCQSLSSVGWKD